jgi:1,2-phenylacetyl-CoA epoxidase catalytic subunit
MSSIGDFVIRQLKDNIETKLIVQGQLFFSLIEKMGVSRDYETLSDILDHLHTNNIEIHFGAKDYEKSIEFAYIRNHVKLFNNLRLKKDYLDKINYLVNKPIKMMDDSFLDEYCKIEDE